MLKYYWNQTIYFDLIQGSNLSKPPEFITEVKLNILDVYKGKSLCDRLSCDVEPMTIFYTKDGEVVEQSTMCDRPHIVEKLKSLL